MRNSILLLITAILLSACGPDYPAEYYETDAARKKVEDFYQDLQEGEYTQVLDHFSNEYYANSSREEITRYFVERDSLLGEVEKWEFVETNVEAKDDQKIPDQFILIYTVKYEKGESKEKFLIKKGEEEFQIAKYSVSSPQLENREL